VRYIEVSKEEVISEIQKALILESKFNELISKGENHEFKTQFDIWRECVIRLLKSRFNTHDLALEFEAETVYLENSLSKSSTKVEASKAVGRGKMFLSRLIQDISDNVYGEEKTSNEIPKKIALIIIKRILENFYKHIQVMYHSEVHGKSKILKNDLDKIKIGNEYDVQRILYSLKITLVILS